MKTKITLPLGARLAAEYAYANLPAERRGDRAYVAEVILIAAAPFMAPVVAQLGRCRISETSSKDILRYRLAGQTVAELADRFAVSESTIIRHVNRGLSRAGARVASGTSIATIAAENQVPPSAVRVALANWWGRRVA